MRQCMPCTRALQCGRTLVRYDMCKVRRYGHAMARQRTPESRYRDL